MDKRVARNRVFYPNLWFSTLISVKNPVSLILEQRVARNRVFYPNLWFSTLISVKNPVSLIS